MKHPKQVENRDLFVCYRYLKSLAYYENLNIFLKSKIASFETKFFHDSQDDIENYAGPMEHVSEWNAENNENHPFIKVAEFLNSDNDLDDEYFSSL